MKKLSVLELQQREHSSCPLLGSLFCPPSLCGPLVFWRLPWTCQQHLRNIALTSTVSHQSLNEEVGEGLLSIKCNVSDLWL